MTATAASIGRVSGLMAPVRFTGESEPAKSISRMQEDVVRQLLSSYVIAAPTERVFASLEQVRSEASRAGWDGYGAKPIDPFAYMYARSFLSALPTTAPIPEVAADSDGEVSFDWSFGNRQALTVSIGRDGRCTFAWMNGQSTYRGTEWIEDDIPASIVFALGQLARSAGARRF
jgi:hypothetical protein